MTTFCVRISLYKDVRKSYIANDYRPEISFQHIPFKLIGYITLPPKTKIYPGDNRQNALLSLNAERVNEYFINEGLFYLYEGHKCVGEGYILKYA